ncbi:MAG: flagellar basal body rod protein FlgC [Schwartzia sp.]|nr:flagellar basal body rod protein FlgC [Schwartzia sp. (in: firmicutes)]
MSMFGSIDTAASGLTAERLRMDVISNNLANANTTRTAEGGAYHRRYVVFQPRELNEKGGFLGYLDTAIRRKQGYNRNRGQGNGVRALRIQEDRTPGPLVYDPGNPDANEQGYVERPNVNPVAEMVDMITASRGYEANATTIQAAKSMAQSALKMGSGS